MKMWQGEILISSIFIVLSVIFFIMAGEFAATMNPLDVGPAAFPRMMLVIIAFLAALQIVFSLRNRGRLIAEKKESPKVTINNKLLLLITVVLLFAYGHFLQVIGFYIATAVFIFVIMFLMGNRKWLQLVLIPIGFNLLIHLTFVMTLGLRLP